MRTFIAHIRSSSEAGSTAGHTMGQLLSPALPLSEALALFSAWSHDACD